MANNIFTGAIDSFFDKNGNWSLGVAPTQTDGNITMLDATSPNCVVRGFQSCMNFTCTGFTGSLTINSGFYLRCFGTVLTLSGTMTILGSGTLDPSNTMTITTNGTNVPYVNFTYSNFFTFTFADTFNNSTSFRSVVGSAIFNGADLYLGGNVNIASSTGGGTSTFRYTGSSGTWTCVANQSLKNNFTIEAGANLTISGTVYYNTGTLTVDPAATVVTTGSTITFGTSTTSTPNVIFNKVSLNAARPLKINSDLKMTSDLIILDSLDSINKNTTEKVYIGGSLNINYIPANPTFNGDATLVFNGTGSIGMPLATSKFALIIQPFEINTVGIITFTANSNTLRLNNSIKHVSGTVVSTNANLIAYISTTFDTSGIVWNSMVFSTGTIQFDSTFKATNSSFDGAGATTFTGSFGFNIANYTIPVASAAKIITYKVGNVYSITNSIQSQGTAANHIFFKSSASPTKAKLVLSYGATQSLINTDATDIDSSGGQTINTSLNSLLNNTINWQLTEGNWWLVLNKA